MAGRCWEDSGEQDKEGNCPCGDFSHGPRVLIILEADTNLLPYASQSFSVLYVIDCFNPHNSPMRELLSFYSKETEAQ